MYAPSADIDEAKLQEWDSLLLLEYPVGTALQPQELARTMAKDRLWLELRLDQACDIIITPLQQRAAGPETAWEWGIVCIVCMEALTSSSKSACQIPADLAVNLHIHTAGWWSGKCNFIWSKDSSGMRSQCGRSF